MRLLAASAVFLCALVLPAAGGADRGADAARAIQSYVAMQRYLFDVRSGLYRERIGSLPSSHAWPESQALAATIGVARVPGANPMFVHAAERRLARLERLRSGGVYQAFAGGDVYYDDNEWIAQDLLDAAEAWHDHDARARVTAIFAAVVRAWDTDASHPCSGGVFWTTAAGVADRNTVSTANGALVGLRLYALTKRPVLLYWSRQMLDWLDRCMLASNGLYWDHIDSAGSVDATQWSYNQGSLIGAYVELYETTGDASALTRAERLADASLEHFDSARLSVEPPEFAAIFFRNLLTLATLDGRTAYVDAAEAYGQQAWQTLRDPATGLFGRRLLDQAALVQIYVALASVTGS